MADIPFDGSVPTNDRSIGWVGSISDQMSAHGTMSFSKEELTNQEHLFAHRAALFYTPTQHIPASHVGSGTLDISIPVTAPDFTALHEIPAYRSPRLWVDLLQQQTGKVRWSPIAHPRVEIFRYDYYRIRHDHVAIGVKALIDALKVRTSGRRDGTQLFYFGAIEDDGPNFIDLSLDQVLVEHPKHAHVRVRVSTR